MRTVSILIELWDRFNNIPIDNNDLTLKKFLHFELGTNRFLIWDWFETQNPAFKIIDHLILKSLII